MIRGAIRNPFQLIKNLSKTARQLGATRLRIEATVVNKQLYNALTKYGIHSEGGLDVIEIQLK